MEQLIETTSQTRQAKAIEGRSAKGKVTGKLKTALDLMVWEGKPRDVAASEAGLTTHSLREAMKRPHVMEYYNTRLQVLRDNERARNIHRLVEIRDAANNMPAVNAIKLLEQLSDEATPGHQRGMQQAPGLTVIVNTIGTRLTQPAPLIIDNDGNST